ncbi:MAG: HEAT repeat domain-containing protein [Chloroflexota bacterium]
MEKSFKNILKQIAADEQLHTSYLYVLSKLNQESLDIFQNEWPTIATQRRRDIMQELVEISEANFEVYFDPVFLLGLADEDAQVRASAINGLWENETPALIGPLVHLLKTDKEALVRAAAASALGKYIYLRELEELDPAPVLVAEQALLETIHLAGEDIEVRRRAVEAIAYSGEAGIVDIIENAYYDDDEKMQVSAIFAMGRNADKRWRPRVITELDNPNNEIRYEAARACGELEAHEAVLRLVDLIEQDPDLEVQEMAIWAMGRIGGPQARDALVDCLDSEIEALALAAEEALDELNLFEGSFDLFNFDEDDLEDFDELDDEANGYYSRGDYLN